MTSSGHLTQTQRADIDAALTRFERREAERRRIEAEQLADLAEALEAAVGDPVAASAVASAASKELAYRSLRLELAALLHQSEHVAERLLDAALSASRDFSASLEALRRGDISQDHLRVITIEGAPLSSGNTAATDEGRAAYETAVLEVALYESPNRLRPIARRLAAAQQEATLEERHERAVKRRCVRVVDADDGMADLTAHLPAEEAYAIYNRLTRIAADTSAGLRAHPQRRRVGAGHDSARRARFAPGTGLQPEGLAPEALRVEAHSPEALSVEALSPEARSTEGPRRTRDERRADAFRDLLLDAPGEAREAASRIRGQVQVVIPASVLAGSLGPGGRPWPDVRPSAVPGAEARDSAGHDAGRGAAAHRAPASGDVAELIGYGPIAAEPARKLAADAEAWERVTVNLDGEVLAVDRYRPTPRMRRLLAARDLHCRAPGCRVAAYRCDIDHTQDAASGGPTSTANLAHLCRGHHTLKHHTDWELSQHAGGVMRWTSPTGRQYSDRPASRVRFRQPA